MGLLARIVAETGSELHDRNNVWTAPARAERMLAFLRKSLPVTTFFKDFDFVLSAKSTYLGHFGLTMALWFAAGCGVVVGVMENVGTQPRTTLSQRAKSI